MPSSEPFEFADMLPDYVAECDEHLTAAGRVLLEAEAAPDLLNRGELDELFRNFHTVKGLSAMAGVRAAERLAHAMESYLGTVRKGQFNLTPESAAALIAGVQMLDAVVAARRDERPQPDVDPLIARVTALMSDRLSPHEPATTPSSKASETHAKIEAAARQGRRVWQVTFVPEQHLAERGINVNEIRERLQTAGEIIDAAPTVIPGGGISFSFIASSSSETFAADIGGEGVTVQPFIAGATSTSTQFAEAGKAPSALTPSNLVRVDLARLDDLMRSVGELVVTRARLDNGLGRVAGAVPMRQWRELQDTSQVLERQLRDLREGVMRVRMVPVRDLFARMQFVIRDLARESGKQATLERTGEDTEIDKFVVERLADPLLHLVRNAMSHGLESPGERIAAGKPPQGRIALRAKSAGGAIIVDVEDDGSGIDPEQVFARARAVGLLPANARTDPSAMLDLICMPGFSTQENVDRGSGRGVGMDVVLRSVEELGGELALASTPRQGTRFTIRLPLTLAIADALVVEVGGQAYAFPQVAISEVIEVDQAAITVLENNELLRHRSGVLPILRLTDVFGAARRAAPFPALVVGEGGNAVAVAADRLLGLREVVLHPLADPLVQAPGLAGATELGDGRAVLMLDAAGLTRIARSRRGPGN